MALLVTSVFGVAGCGSNDGEVPVESRIKNSRGYDERVENADIGLLPTSEPFLVGADIVNTPDDRERLNAGFHVGVDTVGQSLRDANRELRSEPSASDAPSKADCALLFLVDSDLRDLLNSLALLLSANSGSLGVLLLVDSDLRGLLNSLTRLDNDDLDALLDHLDSLALRDLLDLLPTISDKKAMEGDTLASRALRRDFRNRFDSLDLRNRLDLDDLRNFLSQCDAASKSGVDSVTTTTEPPAPATEPEGDDVDRG
jgi:hypothetical protein